MFSVSDITFYLIYRSPNAPPSALSELECVVRKVGKNSVLIGDFNLPDIDWEAGTGSARTASFIEAVDDAMLEQMVDFSTQVKGNRLDLVLTNMAERILDICEAGRLGRSDHEMILVSVNMECTEDRIFRERPNWGKANWTNMRKELAKHNWTLEFETKTAEEMWRAFSSELTELVRGTGNQEKTATLERSKERKTEGGIRGSGEDSETADQKCEEKL